MNLHADSSLARALRGAGHRVSRPRTLVWNALHEVGGHVTADQLAARLDGGVSTASVYRALSLFQELGLVRESDLGSHASRWEPVHGDEQVHLVCESCEGVLHHPTALVDDVRDHLLAEHGFAAADVEVVVHGTCATCRDQRPPVPLEA